MIEFHQNDHQQQLVLTPNRSMSWKNNKRVLLALLCVNMSIAIAWSLMGAWMVLPFAGLEVLCVGLGMYYVSWKLSFKQIITIQADSLVLQTGVYFPKQEWQWQLGTTHLLKKPSKYRMSAPDLYLKNMNEKVEIGHFLNVNEKKDLRQHLNRFGILELTI